MDAFGEFNSKDKRPEDILLDGRMLYEQRLYNYKCLDPLPVYTYSLEDMPKENIEYPLYQKIGILEGLVSYYHDYYVSDDDLDVIRDVMSSAYDDLDLYEDAPEYGMLLSAYEKACICLESRYVVFDECWTYAVKSLDEVNGPLARCGSWGRDWGQVQQLPDVVETFADNISYECDVGEIVDENAIKVGLREVLNTLTDKERQVIDFRFGLSDGYSRLLEEVGQLFNVSRLRIMQIEARALRKLRSSGRLFALLSFLPYSDEEYKDAYDKMRIMRSDKLAKQMAVVTEKHATVSVPEEMLKDSMRLGSVQMTVGEWLEQFGLTEDTIAKFVHSQLGEIVWSVETIARAMVNFVLEKARSFRMSALEVLDSIYKGYSPAQAFALDFEGMPANIEKLTIYFDGKDLIIGQWFEENNISADQRKSILNEMVKDGDVSLNPMYNFVAQHKQRIY